VISWMLGKFMGGSVSTRLASLERTRSGFSAWRQISACFTKDHGWVRPNYSHPPVCAVWGARAQPETATTVP